MYYPISSAQQVFHPGEAIDQTLWNHAILFLFEGHRSQKVLMEALSLQISRTDILRMGFKQEGEKVIQHFSADISDHIFIKSFSSREELNIYAQEDVNISFDLFGSSLFRITICYLPGQYGYLFTTHHITCDGLCVPILIRQMQEIFAGEVPEEVFHYTKLMERDAKYAESWRKEKDMEYWKTALSSDFTRKLFPGEKGLFHFESKETIVPFAPSLMENARSFCDSIHVSLSSFIYAVFGIYVKRLLDVGRFSVGAPVHNRTSKAEMNTLGTYMHILPMVCETDASLTAAEYLRYMHKTFGNLLKRHNYTLYDIQKDLGEQDLYDTVVDYQPNPGIKGCDYQIFFSNSLSTALELHFWDTPSGFQCISRYRTALFKEEDILMLLKILEAIMEACISHPDKTISELPILPRDTALSYLSGPEVFVDPKETLYSLFEKQAEKHPEKICFECETCNLTFKDFRTYAEKIDTAIRNTQKASKRIAVFANRGIEMYASIYGILRSGAAYLPISPDYPVERIRYILEDSQTDLILAEGSLCGRLSALGPDIRLLNVTEILAKPLEAETLPPCAAVPEDAAYIIYTSGSTGNPKGAMVSHRSAINRIQWMENAYSLGENGIILQKTPYTFDVSVWEIFWWGLYGGRLCISKPGEHFLPARILHEVNAHKVTHLHFVPSVFALFLDYLEKHPQERQEFQSVRYVFLSGEELKAELVNRFHRLYPETATKFVNLYGPTECAIDVTEYLCNPTETDPIPIGRPIDNTQILILDRYGMLLPAGMQGEICIAGMNVGLGYLGRPELTAEKFTSHPETIGKLYHTGDLGLVDSSGNVIYLGRMDHMVKLHGQRIELGEIEAQLLSIDGIHEAAVLMSKNGQTDFLSAFYTGKSFSKEELENLLSQKIPGYMVPSYFRHLASMPIGANGKLDRRVLLSSLESLEADEVQEPPQNALEEKICQAFAEILEVPGVGRNTNFVSIGGTSLHAIALLSRDEFSDLTPAEFIAHATPRALAEYMTQKNAAQYRHLHSIGGNPDGEHAMVIFPFAGARPEAFLKFAEALQHKHPELSLWYAPYPHSDEECRLLAAEIEHLSQAKPITFYSHCVGSSVVLKVYEYLPEKARLGITHYYAAANVPFSRLPGFNFWRIVPDFLLTLILKKAGANPSSWPEGLLKKTLSDFRQDTEYSIACLQGQKEKLAIPTTILLAEDDLFTRPYKNPERNWLSCLESIEEIIYLPTASHYFQSDNTDQLLSHISITKKR